MEDGVTRNDTMVDTKLGTWPETESRSSGSRDDDEGKT